MGKFAFLLLCTVVQSNSFTYFTGCASSRFGPTCEGQCECQVHDECDEGLSGGGECYCSALHLDQCTHKSSTSLEPLDSELLSFAYSTRSPRSNFAAHGAFVTPMPLRGARVVIGHKLPDPTPLWLDLVSAQIIPMHAPYAHNYGGHQFGQWAGQLGDGRSICLGVDPVLGEVCLKGSGPTIFSRRGDGRAALANACREYLADTALIALGVPAFRSLSLVTSEQHDVFRDGSYSQGRRDATPAVILARAGPSFLRVGSVQLMAKRQPGSGLEPMLRYALIRLHEVETKDDEAVRYYDRFGLEGASAQALRSQCFFGASDSSSCAANASLLPRLDLFRCLLARVSRRVAALTASWAASGFVHGVLNTDNLSLFGSTIDLNVFGFISRYDPKFTPNFIDTNKRYSYENQASMVKWDLLRLVLRFVRSIHSPKTRRTLWQGPAL